jgi:hypothetical protein
MNELIYLVAKRIALFQFRKQLLVRRNIAANNFEIRCVNGEPCPKEENRRNVDEKNQKKKEFNIRSSPGKMFSFFVASSTAARTDVEYWKSPVYRNDLRFACDGAEKLEPTEEAEEEEDADDDNEEEAEEEGGSAAAADCSGDLSLNRNMPAPEMNITMRF